MDFQVFASIIGIAFAALISASGYLYKNRMETKRSARKVLYYLLEIRYAINTSLIDPASIYDQYITHCFKAFSDKGGIVNRGQVESLIGKYVYQHFVNIADSLKTDIDERILIPYEQALLELSEINPTLAYKLRGKERLQHAITHTSAYSDTFENEILPTLPLVTGEMSRAIKKFSSSQKNEALDDIENSFNDQILMVAKSCGVFDYLKCKKILKQSIDQSVDFPDFSNALDEITELLITELAKS
ncbi:hypothetical protein ACX0MV_15905 [Pseudomonas borbori]